MNSVNVLCQLRYVLVCSMLLLSNVMPAQESKARVMVIFAHPDEGEIYTGGISALYTQAGHEVKFLSVTNGNAGHYSMQPGPLAKRRLNEAMQAKEILGISDYQVMDYDDGKLKNSVKVQKEIANIITDWSPQIIYTFYPAMGGHNDNMAVGWIVRDALKFLDSDKIPVVMYMRDFFTIKLSHTPDFAVIIDDVWDKKLEACAAHVSQVGEAIPHALGILEKVRDDEQAQFDLMFSRTYPYSEPVFAVRKTLEKWYGKKKASRANFVEAFEIAEYGRQITNEDVYGLLPLNGSVNSYTVSGTTEWLDTGIHVDANSEIEFEAEGKVIWDVSGMYHSSPNGNAPQIGIGKLPVNSTGGGALIGRIGESPENVFFIGRKKKIHSSVSGRIYLGINDEDFTDNDGEFKVWIHR
ncbi:PIG-L deacetylase family protein [Flagellimonas sp.]|uniref:PIG-L deacetylase family protein n=1 Tax=Flagellimonas sp. TaxID=2058762 RepID=UPI003BB0455A